MISKVMEEPENKIRLGISSCLAGEKVRYDGGHRWEPFLTETLGKYVEFVPVCPEVAGGLGAPREPMRLVGSLEAPRLVALRTGRDLTGTMEACARRLVGDLEGEGLWGFILKSRSPSCGRAGVKVYGAKGPAVRTGVGIFARIFMERFPLLPVEDEAGLHDPRARENFVEAIFVLRRWRVMVSQEPSRGALAEFHTRHKLLLLAHSPGHYRALGKLVAGGPETALGELYARYQTLLLEALHLKTTVKKNANVLYHLLGYFKKELAPDEKQELLEIIGNYRREYVPLIVPVTLINHYVRKYGQVYLQGQYYLNPHPLELKLRYHV